MSRCTRVMIVDNSLQDMVIMRDIFRQAEWTAEVEEISSGPDAIRALTRHQTKGSLPDLLIIDCLLDGDTCVRTLRIIREIPYCRYQPIIIFSTIFPSTETIHDCYTLGVLAILEKLGNTSGVVKIVASIKDHFSVDGNLTPGGTWIGSGRLFTGGCEPVVPAWKEIMSR
jgi:CheY-like chemotaxis protein